MNGYNVNADKRDFMILHGFAIGQQTFVRVHRGIYIIVYVLYRSADNDTESWERYGPTSRPDDYIFHGRERQWKEEQRVHEDSIF